MHGFTCEEISLPLTEYAIATYYILATAEASSNLARYDSVRYGPRQDNCSNFQDTFIKYRGNCFGKEVKRRIMLGTYVLSAGYYEAYYNKAQKVRTLITQDFHNVFKKVDCLITPTSPTTAFKLGERLNDPIRMYLSDVYTVSANLAGLPAISIPCGQDKKGLPVGIQFIGKPFDELTILQVANFVEKSLNK
jgi:aspartyl-tRNA(Asn)/glutamyl-tRNA(Gln) amidotransferase subunit A